ncbi:MAG: sulfatase-like hydrolase/transferase [Blastocatellia bacterium]
MRIKGKRPNFLIFMVDEERYPSVYETDEVRDWRRAEFKAQDALRRTGIEFHRHYVGATACSPSRATIFTGQYPSLHGVTQTTGTAKGSFDSDVFWLDQNTVPTMGDYFRAGGYRTFYKGKWHVSHADIVLPGTHDALESYAPNGEPIPEIIDLYLRANRLDEYGFNGWVGPEPHGAAKANTGTNRDPGFMTETIHLLDALEAESKKGSDRSPWLIVNSFVNPHDIVLFGLAWKNFGYPLTEGFVPRIPRPPTEGESLDRKPRAQQSYVNVYPKMLTPQPTIEEYRQFYYYLQKESDGHIYNVFERLRNSPFFENTIVLFTSDHGDLLGAHGRMHQKWHQAYEEATHVPLIISNPVLFKEPRDATMLTSHVDLIPTLLGLADIDIAAAQTEVSKSHNETQPLVGRDLSPVVLGKQDPNRSTSPLYFMTDDEISSGQNQISPLTGKSYHSVVQPNHIETVIAALDGPGGEQVWKYSRYFDNPQFWSSPFQQDQVTVDDKTVTKKKPLPPEFEMYNLSADQVEQENLAYKSNRSRADKARAEELRLLLREQRKAKRLYPKSLPVYVYDTIQSD